MGLPDFGILAQIWAVGPNVKEKVIAFLIKMKGKYALVRIALIFVELY